MLVKSGYGSYYYKCALGPITLGLHGSDPYQVSITGIDNLAYKGRPIGILTRWAVYLDSQTAVLMEDDRYFPHRLVRYMDTDEDMPESSEARTEILRELVAAFWQWFRDNEKAIRVLLIEDRLTNYLADEAKELTHGINEDIRLMCDVARELAEKRDRQEQVGIEMGELRYELSKLKGGSNG